MYCQSCNMEIEGKGEKTCPLCHSLLNENSPSTTPCNAEEPEENAKIDALIQDIGEKVDRSSNVPVIMNTDSEEHSSDDKEQQTGDYDLNKALNLLLDEQSFEDASENRPFDTGNEPARNDLTYVQNASFSDKADVEQILKIIPDNFKDKSEIKKKSHETKGDIYPEQVPGQGDQTSKEDSKSIEEVNKKTEEILYETLEKYDPVVKDSLLLKKKKTKNIFIFCFLTLFALAICGIGYIYYNRFVRYDRQMPSAKPILLSKSEKKAHQSEAKSFINSKADKTVASKKSESFTLPPAIQSSKVSKKKLTNYTSADASESNVHKVRKSDKNTYGYLYSVHVASFKSLDDANQEKKRLEAKGYNTYIEPVNLSAMGIWYRVKIGKFSNRNEAMRFANIFEIKEGVRPVILEKNPSLSRDKRASVPHSFLQKNKTEQKSAENVKIAVKSEATVQDDQMVIEEKKVLSPRDQTVSFHSQEDFSGEYIGTFYSSLAGSAESGISEITIQQSDISIELIYGHIAYELSSLSGGEKPVTFQGTINGNELIAIYADKFGHTQAILAAVLSKEGISGYIQWIGFNDTEQRNGLYNKERFKVKRRDIL